MDPLIRRQTIADTLRQTAARHPDAVAIICGDVTWTYREFDRLVTRLAAGLAAQGVGLGERIAVISRNSHSFAALRYALARLGAVLVPINFMLQAGEVAHILRHARCTRLCVDSEFAALGETAAQDTAVFQRIWLPSDRPTPQPAGPWSFY